MIAAILIATALLSQTEYHHRWPLDLTPELTSSFGEYRPGRFHAGIDLRTQGTGRPVLAARKGHVTRIRTSPWGYGKAVYLELDSGYTAIYAHLDKFTGSLRDYVRRAQHKGERYTVDLYPAAGEFPIEAGQVVAYSGRTGIGAPHLHYELRDSAQRPVNPYRAGITWPDATRPRIDKILVAPGGPEARVEGGMAPQVFQTTHLGGGQYRCPPVELRGRVGFGAVVVDPGSGGYKLGVYRLRLLLQREAEGPWEEAFRVEHNELSYDNHRNAAVAYHPFLADQGRFLLLWRWPGNTCASYAASPGDGWVNTAQDLHTAMIEATDFMGNTAQAEIPLGPAGLSPPALDGEPGGRGEVDMACHGTYLLLSATFSAPEAQAPQCEFVCAGQKALLPVSRLDERNFGGRFEPQQSGAYTLRMTHPRMDAFEETVAVARRGGQGCQLKLGALRVNVQPGSPYGVLFAQATESTGGPPAPLPKHGPTYTLWPRAMPIDTPLRIAVPLPPDLAQTNQALLYQWTGSYWQAQDTFFDAARAAFETRSFAPFALMEDRQAPHFSEITPPDGYRAQTRRPHLRAKVADAGSGLVSWSIRCAGAWLLAAYDPEDGLIAWERDEDLPPGKHIVRFEAADKAGNTAHSERQVLIPE